MIISNYKNSIHFGEIRINPTVYEQQQRAVKGVSDTRHPHNKKSKQEKSFLYYLYEESLKLDKEKQEQEKHPEKKFDYKA